MPSPATPQDAAALAATIPADLIALELHRRAVKARTNPSVCGYALYLAGKAVAGHPWITARKADWRTARKALALAAEQATAAWTRQDTAPAAGPDPDGRP